MHGEIWRFFDHLHANECELHCRFSDGLLCYISFSEHRLEKKLRWSLKNNGRPNCIMAYSDGNVF